VHLSRGMATFAARANGAQLVCTLCQPAQATLPLCAGCAEAVREHNIAVDGQRAFALARRAPYYRIFGIDRPKLSAITTGDHVKVGLSKIPLAEPRWLESPWVKVTTRAGDLMRGTIENDLELFSPGDAEKGMEIEFAVDNVVDVVPTIHLTQRDHECAQCLGAGRDLDANDQKLLRDVRALGFHVIRIFADEEGPAYAFTVGLHHSFGHPEVVVMGLDPDTAHGVLNRIGMAAAAEQAIDFDRLLEHTSCELRSPAKPDIRQDMLGYARWFYRSDDFPVRQLVWDGAMVL
jgi:hypothetical protein